MIEFVISWYLICGSIIVFGTLRSIQPEEFVNVSRPIVYLVGTAFFLFILVAWLPVVLYIGLGGRR